MPQKLAEYVAYSWRHLDKSYQFWVESLERLLFDGEKARAKPAYNPESLRAEAVRLFAMAIQVRKTEDADRLIAEAVELQDQASAMEQAAKVPPNERGRLIPADLLVARATGPMRDGFPPSAAQPTSPQGKPAERSAPLAVEHSTLLGHPIPVSSNDPRRRCEGIVEQQRLETT
jgi:hypothetical protein